MKRSTEVLGGVAMTLFFAALSVWLFSLSKMNFDFTVMRINCLALSLAALAGFAVNSLLLRRGAAMWLYFLVQLAMIAGAAYLFVHSVTLEPFQTRTVVINCIIYCVTLPLTGFLAFEPPRKITLLIAFDLVAVGIAILLLLDHVRSLPALRPALIIDAAALACVLLALISERVGRFHAGQENVRGSGVGGKLLLGVLFAAVVGLTAAVAAVASVGIRRVSEAIVAALQWLWNGIWAVLKFLYHLLEAFLLWLASFAEETPMEALPGPAMDGNAEVFLVPGEILLPPWLIWAGVALAAALVLLILLKLRKRRFSRSVLRSLRKPVSARRENDAGKALRSLLEKLRAALRFRLHCLLRRNSAAGLLLWCEHRAPKPDARREGESGEAFLRRLAEKTQAAPLAELAALVERSFYAPGRVEVPPQLCRAVRSIRFTA